MTPNITTQFSFSQQQTQQESQFVEVAKCVKQNFEKANSADLPNEGKQMVQVQLPQQMILHTIKMKQGF